MPDLANVAETPVLVKKPSAQFWRMAMGRLGVCKSFINHYWKVGRARHLSLRFSTQASTESVQIVLSRDERIGFLEWRGKDDQAHGDMTDDAEEWLEDSGLVPCGEPFTRTLHVSVFIHEKT